LKADSKSPVEKHRGAGRTVEDGYRKGKEELEDSKSFRSEIKKSSASFTVFLY
jgi:hypothetical protein